MSAAQTDITWVKKGSRAASPEDSRAIAQAYIGLLLVLQQSSNTKSLPIDFMGDLASFVLHVTE
ncbi:hypothetical protein FS749_002892 [Ceratobasidium sp. UAMH 11750]|nr:hypothetical protein FS749_002892 [Ceratobasidium sp. UAMH 11750]